VVSVDLNADLGEGWPTDLQMLEVVTSASLACAVHAGTPPELLRLSRAAVAAGVAIGAHPSYPDREGFGRREMYMGSEELLAWLSAQVGAVGALAALAGGRVAWVKPHGALYNKAAQDPQLADVVVRAVRASGGGAGLMCPPGSQLERAGAKAGLAVAREGFADRAYGPDGALLERSVPGAVYEDPAQAASQALSLVLRGQVTTPEGQVVAMEVDSICVHGDSPKALSMAQAVREALVGSGVTLKAFFG